MSLPTPLCSTPQHAGFDFWIGEWELSWPAEQMGGSPGEQGSGTNRVERVLDGCVIQENFSTNDGSFRGHSVSVFDIDTGIWRQTWVDSSAGYIVLTGRFEGDMLILTTEPRERDGQVALNRMVFRDIGPDSLNWDWQGVATAATRGTTCGTSAIGGAARADLSGSDLHHHGPHGDCEDARCDSVLKSAHMPAFGSHNWIRLPSGSQQ